MTAYTDRLDSVKALLSHLDAINCVIDDSIPEVWHESGDSAEDAATELNERHRRGYNSESEIAQTILASTE
mgnify:CR=1 FL=1